MNIVRWLPILGLVGLLGLVSSARGQTRPYIGFAYPAGGQQGTTFAVRLGGQGVDEVDQVLVTGTGVSAKVVEVFRKLGPQDTTLLREQLNELKRELQEAGNSAEKDEATVNLAATIEKRMAAYVNRPACVSISTVVFVEVTIAPDAEPGRGNCGWQPRVASRTRWSSTSANCPNSPAIPCALVIFRCSARRNLPSAKDRRTRWSSALVCLAPPTARSPRVK